MVRIISKSRRYVEELKESMSIKKEVDQKKINSLYDVRKRLIKKRDRYNIIRVIFYIALYASILSSFTSILNLFPVISKFLDFILTFLGIVGTTFSIIMIFFLSQSINNYNRDISTIDSHIISIYVKYDKTDAEYFDKLVKKIR